MNKRANMEAKDDVEMSEGSNKSTGSASGENGGRELRTTSTAPPIQAPATPYKELPGPDYEEWEYAMRREMQEILPGLFLGPYSSASGNKAEDLKARGISHIICVRHIMERNVIRPMHPQTISYLVIEMKDDETESLIPHCQNAHRFLNDCFARGGKALVHGNAGISRSASLVVAYVMAIYGVTLRSALSFVQTKRLSANPGEWFMLQLKEYEPIYQALHDAPRPLPDGAALRPSLKRELDDDDESDDDDMRIDD